MDGKWELLRKDKKYSDDELMKYLMMAEKKIIVLDGYSGCGKTMLLRRMKKELPEKVQIFSDEKLIDIMMKDSIHHPAEGSEMGRLLTGRNKIICIEDVDLYRGKTATQIEVGVLVRQLAQENLVVLTGNYMHRRVPDLMKMTEGETWHAEVRRT